MESVELKASCWVSEYITPFDAYLHGITRVLFDRTTAFQHAQVVESGVSGLALVLDGKWQSCTGDEFLYHEPLVQPACCLLAIRGHPPKRVLVLGGGEGATTREILRWTSLERTTMVDIDGEVVDACREHMRPMHRGAFDDPRAETVIADALEYIDTPDARPDGGWDLIISDLSDPIEHGPSFRLFTREYFDRLRPLLAPHGILCVQAGPTSPPEIHRHAGLSSTLRAVFGNVRSLQTMVPNYAAPWSYILASTTPLPAPAGPDEIDRILAEHTSETTAPFGGERLKMFDGETWFALSSLPLHLRRAIESETTVFTESEPARFFGSGVLQT